MTTVERRRELLEEIVHQRSRAVAELGIDAGEPPRLSALWPLAIARLAGRAHISPRRDTVLSVAVVALAWLEAFEHPE